MYTVDIWVPTKGWKNIFRTTNLEKAHRKAIEFHPLETRVTRREGKQLVNYWCGGRLCMPNFDVKPNLHGEGEEYLAKVGVI